MKEISRRLPSLLEPSCRKLLTTIIQAFEKMRREWRLNLPADLLTIPLEPTEVEVIVPGDLIIFSSQDSLELARSSVEKLK